MTPSSTPNHFCTKCGRPLTARFCTNCGADSGGSVASKSSQANVSSATNSSVTQPLKQNSAGGGAPPVKPPNPKPPVQALNPTQQSASRTVPPNSSRGRHAPPQPTGFGVAIFDGQNYTCPNCQDVLAAGLTKCPKCGKMLSARVPSKVPPVPPRQQSAPATPSTPQGNGPLPNLQSQFFPPQGKTNQPRPNKLPLALSAIFCVAFLFGLFKVITNQNEQNQGYGSSRPPGTIEQPKGGSPVDDRFRILDSQFSQLVSQNAAYFNRTGKKDPSVYDGMREITREMGRIVTNVSDNYSPTAFKQWDRAEKYFISYLSDSSSWMTNDTSDWGKYVR